MAPRPGLEGAPCPAIRGSSGAQDATRIGRDSQMTDTPGGMHAKTTKGVTMRFGFMRGAAVAALMILASAAQSALADGFIKTIPREVLAQDLNTGQPYFAPPVPWGHYAKDGPFDHFYPKGCGLCGLLHGHKGCCGSNCFGRACFSRSVVPLGAGSRTSCQAPTLIVEEAFSVAQAS